jgi:hypothetical protein
VGERAEAGLHGSRDRVRQLGHRVDAVVRHLDADPVDAGSLEASRLEAAMMLAISITYAGVPRDVRLRLLERTVRGLESRRAPGCSMSAVEAESSAIAAARGARVSGIDAATGLLEFAERKLPGAEVDPIEHLPWPDDSFDLISGFNAFPCDT